MFEQLRWSDAEPSEFFKIGLFLAVRFIFNIPSAVDLVLVQIHSCLSVGSSLINSEHKIDPWCYVTFVECLAVLEYKLSWTFCPGWQFHILYTLFQVIKTEISIAAIYQERRIIEKFRDQLLIVGKHFHAILPCNIYTVKDLVLGSTNGA